MWSSHQWCWWSDFIIFIVFPFYQLIILVCTFSLDCSYNFLYLIDKNWTTTFLCFKFLYQIGSLFHCFFSLMLDIIQEQPRLIFFFIWIYILEISFFLLHIFLRRTYYVLLRINLFVVFLFWWFPFELCLNNNLIEFNSFGLSLWLYLFFQLLYRLNLFNFFLLLCGFFYLLIFLCFLFLLVKLLCEACNYLFFLFLLFLFSFL